MKKIDAIITRNSVLAVVLILLTSIRATAAIYTLDLALSGQNEVPANGSPATGILIGSYDESTNVLTFNLMFSGLTGPTTAAHIHGPALPGTNGPVLIPLAGFPTGVTSGSYANSYTLTQEQQVQLLCGKWYVNIHTTVFPGGEIRSQLLEGTTAGNITTLAIALTGQNEVPPNASTATGILTGTFDSNTKLLSLNMMFNGLSGTTTAAHLHSPAAPGVNAGVQVPLTGFPTGVTSGIYSNTFLLTAVQESHLLSGLMYVNIHTVTIPGGEIRGQLTEGTMIGDCGSETVPVSNWALFIGILLISVFAFVRLRNRT